MRALRTPVDEKPWPSGRGRGLQEVGYTQVLRTRKGGCRECAQAPQAVAPRQGGARPGGA